MFRFEHLKRSLQCSYQTQYQTTKWILKLSIPSRMISGSNWENLKHIKLQPNPIYPYAYKKNLHHRCYIVSSTPHYIIIAALHRQQCSVSSTLHHSVNAALKNGADILAELCHAIQSFIREFCPITNSILIQIGNHL